MSRIREWLETRALIALFVAVMLAGIVIGIARGVTLDDEDDA